MESWSNIEVAADDPEVLEIEKIQKLIGDIPSTVIQIRELITGFEICHFKYLQHLEYIRASIDKLKPNIELQRVGAHHIRQAEVEWMKDTTGRSQLGHKYVNALQKWIRKVSESDTENISEDEIEEKTWRWLGDKDPEKIRLTKLLVARLKWDWESYERLLKGDDKDELEYQVCRMDICHYTFPDNMNLIIQAIGNKQPVKNFEGCGSFNKEIKSHLEVEFRSIMDQLQTYDTGEEKTMNQFARIWLLYCLAKTIKEQSGLKEPLGIT